MLNQIFKLQQELQIINVGKDGELAEWLGGGLQNLSDWFDSNIRFN
jgi:hypothetical protein